MIVPEKQAMIVRSLIQAIAMVIAGTGLLTAQDPPIRVFASNGVKAVLEDLQPQCERAIRHPFAINFNSTIALRQKIDSGEPFDVVILTAEAIGDLIQHGKLNPGTRTDVARCGIGIGVRAGAPKPDIRTSQTLRATLRDARSITYAEDGASKPHIERMFERLGITKEVKPRLVLQQGSTRATASVRDGEVELLITLISEILPVQGVDLVGPLPAEFQSYVSFAAAISTNARNRESAEALIKFLTGPAAAPVFKTKGLEPR
jgi:molybdate transport system substrate-binding protein